MTQEILSITGIEPINKNEAKQWLRVFHNNDDTLLVDTLIPAVRSFFETRLSVSLIEKTMRITVNNADRNFLLPQWPIIEITDIEPADVTQTDGRLDNLRGADLDVTYKTGQYVKSEVKLAMLNLLAHWYVNRDMSTTPESVEKVIKANTRILWFV